MKARIIRADAAASCPPRRPNPELTRVIGEAEQQASARATAMVEHAEQQARALVERARAEAERIVATARAESEAVHARELTSVHEQFVRRGQALLDELRADLTGLGVRIAEKLLGEQLRVAPESVGQLVGQVLQSAGPIRHAVIRAHPQDVPLLEARLAELQGTSDAERLAVKPDDTIARGGCVLDSPLGEVDGRVQTQLQTIAAALRGEG